MQILVINQFFWPDTAATGQLLADVACGIKLGKHRITVVCGPSNYGGFDDTPPPHATILRSKGTAFGRDRCGRLMSYISFLASASWSSAWIPRPDLVITM